MASYGARINSVHPQATAVAQRDSVLKLLFENFWSDPADDDYHLGWIREFYRDVYVRTGGVPVHDELTDGCYVNYPDVDLNDGRWNSSGVEWAELYYGANYPRLREIKRR
ncbi:BBE domain-containing protein [Saccharopolyspora sp. NPDC050389]|uniref:BBE domain-containing protein n=1 Tax=Saccharopolyspora sp. NPDC050389 TaxID=3155516 RepID=UPI0033EA4099